MKKMISFLTIISFLLIGVYGCSQSQEDEPKEVAKQFITAKYQIDDYENIPDIAKNAEKYLTPEQLKRFRTNREGYMAQDVAKDLKVNIEVKDISLEEKKKEKNRVMYDYNVTILLKDQNGNEVHSVHKTGQITLINSDEKWLVDHDWSDKSKIPNTNFSL
ncbi:hypothetical protein EDD69_104252 [Thermolongibacillus altinsuensis]|jgi:hypothetical protein|uniref:Uncharacterized protein n=1 Tax=Thermolongibacillus altinsuensis TaxID=575256 RepID=A0A4R1QI54_9BACL|nr:hypothetical protein [Thermolongibacillus altinsuensis]TCL51196.1 hypothetical protein EDD69_104252 [Thermolongibacillus altinsuensis]GMB08737.1 hypothetical protein B1no1_14470 [Thermolongibacillus altinsuensis]